MPVLPEAVDPAPPPLIPDPPAVPLLIPAPPALPPVMLDPPADPPVVPDPLPAPPGCMAGDPEVVDPEPVATGRSDEGAVVVCAKAGTATRAVANKQAVIWVLSISLSPCCRWMCMRSPRRNA